MHKSEEKISDVVYRYGSTGEIRRITVRGHTALRLRPQLKCTSNNCAVALQDGDCNCRTDAIVTRRIVSNNNGMFSFFNAYHTDKQLIFAAVKIIFYV